MIKTQQQAIETSQGIAYGLKLEWQTFSLLLITAPKGFLACGIFDLAAIDTYARAAALVSGSPDNPIGTIDRMCERTLTSVNKHAEQLGLAVGMPVREALELLF